MRRREFLLLSAASAAGVALASRTFAEELADVKIVRIIAFELPTKRVKFVGKNARLDDHGDHSSDRIVRLITNTGIEGFGVCHAKKESLQALLNQPPKAESLGAQNAAMWDLLGKLSNKPAYQLLSKSPSGPREVDVYDGSVYFADLIPRYHDNWKDRFKEEVDDLVSRGHRALKAKIGRGNKWMPRDEGDTRDIEVLKVLREHAGKDVKIAVDANNGYLDVARFARLLDALPNYNFDFLEEMFPEEVEKDLALKDELKKRNLKTLLADGETQSNIGPLKPLMEAKALDLFQLDINGVGCDGLIEEAALAAPNGGRIAPHSWGTLVGFYAMMHVARAIPNFYSGEQDPLTSDVVIAEGYEIENGRCTVPDSPGFGLKLNEKRLADVKPTFDLKS